MMNPYNQQYPYNYTQSTPGPPQPQWQAPPRRQGWGDPRPQGQQQQPSGPQSPVSPYQSGPFGYHPPPPPPPPLPSQPAYGSGYAPQSAPPNQFDTSTWGVKYNQAPQQFLQEEQRPPLPPRPLSAASHPSPKPEHLPSSNQWQQNYGASQPGNPDQNQWTDPYYAQAQHQIQSQIQSHDAPPIPPPRPPKYQNQYQEQGVPQEHYSQHPPTHHYDPPQVNNNNVYQQHSSQQYNMGAASVPYQRPVDNAPVSPIEHDLTSQLYSSALGTGGPSDWEHFGGPPPEMSPDAASPPPRMGATATPGYDAPMQTKPSFAPEQVTQPVTSTTFESPAPMHAALSTLQKAESFQTPPPASSNQSSFRSDGIKRTGTIDSVIQAWNTPLKLPPKSDLLSDSRPASQGSAQAQSTASAPVQERIVEVEKIMEKVVDPYDDLEPEAKATLRRYAAMLRKESAADTDEEKFSIFEAFVAKELRVRSITYGVEPRLKMAKAEPLDSEKTLPKDSLNTSNTAPAVLPEAKLPDIQSTLGQSSASQPTAPISTAVPQPEPESFTKASVPPSAPQKTANTNVAPARQSSKPVTPNPIAIPQKGIDGNNYSSKNISSMDDANEDEPEFSPGGRPRVKRPANIVTSRPNPLNQTQAGGSQMSPGANAPMVLEDYAMPGLPSPSAHAPMIIEPRSATDLPQVVTPGSTQPNGPASSQSNGSRPNSTPAIKFEPARPAYLPFKYNSNVEAPRLPPEQSYSSLRKDGAGSGRLLVHEPKLPTSLNVAPDRSSTPSQRVHDEAFIGLIRQQSKAIRKKTPEVGSLGPIAQLRPGTPARTPTPAQQPPPPLLQGDPLNAATVALKGMLPDTVPDSYGLSEHAKANSVKAAIDAIPDAFGFIHEMVVGWDRENRKVRKKQDDERSVRQADSEQRIDDLFNDNEIGYADIGDLEAEYKLAEAERRYQEDQQELEFFTKAVYNPVTERLQNELAQLNAQYTIATDLLDLESESASRMFKSAASKAEMGFVMTCMLSIFNKLEMRHQKIAEANVERERRRKRLEVTVLYVNGDNAGVKSLEAEFAVAEKMQVLHEARGKDNRANKLMDAFDRATVRGLGDNQTYVDDLLVRIREVKELVLKDPNAISQDVYEPDGPRDSLSLAQKAIDFVLADSQKLLTISNVADKALNDADFGVSVAEARVSSADVSTHDKLAKEKEKEDEKIIEDTNFRMASIAKGPEEASALIREVVDRVGDDAQHKDRIKAALEAAKRRNAEKEGPGADGIGDG